MRYFIIAGEASGVLHGTNLVKALKEKDPEAAVRFWGSDPDRDYRATAVMGFTEVILKGRKILSRLSDCKKEIIEWKPDAVILIDYPGFNFKIAGFTHSKGIKTIWYIAPKVWASREGRIKKLKSLVDRLYIVFPFEKDYFTRNGVSFVYKGNPLLDAIDGSPALKESREAFLGRHGLQDRPYIALLAGSRSHEIKTMMPKLRGFMELMLQFPEYSSYRFIIAAAPGRTEKDYSNWTEGLPVDVVTADTYAVLAHAEAAVINSGTASLEAALIGTPQVVCYQLGSRLTFLIGRQLLKVKFISLGNLILGHGAFREFLQDYFTPENVLLEIRRILEDEACREKMKEEYRSIRGKLGGSGASSAVAEDMVDFIRGVSR